MTGYDVLSCFLKLTHFGVAALHVDIARHWLLAQPVPVRTSDAAFVLFSFSEQVKR
jgi:hypothetical protein